MRVITEDTSFAALVRFLVLPTKVVDTLKNIVTPSVENREVLKCSGSVVTVTNFTMGSDGQTIRLLGDGTTTISNNTNIKTNTGANKLLATNKIYRFTYFKSLKLWVEDE